MAMRPPAKRLIRRFPNDPVDMGNCSRARRAGPSAIAGRRRAQAVAERLGSALLDARHAAGLTQQQASAAAGLSQPRYSELERGLGSGASLETWAVAAAVVGEQLAAFLEHGRARAALETPSTCAARTPLPSSAATAAGWRCRS
jgi:hypothetical protein